MEFSRKYGIFGKYGTFKAISFRPKIQILRKCEKLITDLVAKKKEIFNKKARVRKKINNHGWEDKEGRDKCI